MQIWDNYDLRYFSTLSYFCSNNAKTMELKTGEFPDLEMSPVASMRTCSPMQFATIATTLVICHKDSEPMVYLPSCIAGASMPIANDAYCKFLPISIKLINFLLFLQNLCIPIFPENFKIYVFCLIYDILVSSYFDQWTKMHLCMLYTYWTPLLPSLALSRFRIIRNLSTIKL